MVSGNLRYLLAVRPPRLSGNFSLLQWNSAPFWPASSSIHYGQSPVCDGSPSSTAVFAPWASWSSFCPWTSPWTKWPPLRSCTCGQADSIRPASLSLGFFPSSLGSGGRNVSHLSMCPSHSGPVQWSPTLYQGEVPAETTRPTSTSLLLAGVLRGLCGSLTRKRISVTWISTFLISLS